MRPRSGGLIGVLGLACILGDGGEARAQVSNKQQLRRDRAKIALDAGGVVGGLFVTAVTLNPSLLILSSGSMGVHAYQYGKHKAQGQDEAAGTASAVAQPFESLAAVPGRPGYFYYPSNPNQLYYDPASAPVPAPMQARLPEPARINVRIANTAKDGRTIHYTVAGTLYSVPPGYTQALATPEGSVIAFERGDAAGLERFTLADGDYEFRTADQGWRFYSTGQPGKPTEASKPAVAARGSAPRGGR